jgi:hypothetical protein
VYSCVYCKKSFKYQSQLLRHNNKKKKCGRTKLDINDANNNDILEITDMSMVNKKYKNITQLINTKINKSNNIKCYFCDKVYKNKNNLKVHLNNNCKLKKELINTQIKLNELKQKNKMKK